MTFYVFNSEWFHSVIGFHNMEHVNNALLLNLNLLVSAKTNMSSRFPILMSQHVFKTPFYRSQPCCGLRPRSGSENIVWPLFLWRPSSWSGKIPPESTLTFIIEVLEIRNGPRSHESFQEMDLNDDWKLSKNEVTARLVLLFIALDFNEEWIESINYFLAEN